MYKAYVKEKENLDVFETEHGFGAYYIDEIGRYMNLADFFIKPESRNGLHSTQLWVELKKIAISKGCKKVICQCNLLHEKPEESLFLILRNKFKYSHILNEVIYFYIDL